MDDIQKKREKELEIVGKMIGIYCRGNHSTEKNKMCDNCMALLEYAEKRVKYCPRMDDKTFCSVCPTHCYAPAKREKIREVMRYSGPKMIYYSPITAIRHLYAEWKYKRE